MQLAAKILEYGLLAWFGLLMLLIAVRILRRDIDMSGVLTHRSGDQSVLPERALHMAVFPAVIAYYLYTALHRGCDRRRRRRAAVDAQRARISAHAAHRNKQSFPRGQDRPRHLGGVT
jgi:hypothetical protein